MAKIRSSFYQFWCEWFFFNLRAIFFSFTITAALHRSIAILSDVNKNRRNSYKSFFSRDREMEEDGLMSKRLLLLLLRSFILHVLAHTHICGRWWLCWLRDIIHFIVIELSKHGGVEVHSKRTWIVGTGYCHIFAFWLISLHSHSSSN